MENVTPSPAPQPSPAPATTTTRSRSIINKRQQESLMLADTVLVAARKSDYATVLETECEITPDFLDSLQTDCATARGNLGQIVDSRIAKNLATGGKKGATKALVKAIRKIQAAAKQKYASTQPKRLKDYYIGEKITSSQGLIEQVGTALREKISPSANSKVVADVLPGVKAAKITELSSALDNYIAAWTTAANVKSDTAKGQYALEILIQSIDERRRLIQIAADGQWPFSEPANAPIRREFHLPVSRPFVAVNPNTTSIAPQNVIVAAPAIKRIKMAAIKVPANGNGNGNGNGKSQKLRNGSLKIKA